MTSITDMIRQQDEAISAGADESDRLGQLGERTVQTMREIGIIKMLQPKNFGGLESHPADFLEAVFTLASLDSSAGWVSGVVGLHPWELAQMSENLQEDIWGADPDVWVASPYAPIGRGEAVEGGYKFSGRWPFSSGTDHCQWALLGGVSTENPGEPLHLVLPRKDYDILQDSWNVAGLAGTGSKDVVVTDAFVPTERILPFKELSHGNWNESWPAIQPLYRMPYVVLFPGAITAATLGICQGALNAYLEAAHSKGVAQQTDAKLIAVAEAAADIEVSLRTLLDDVTQVFDAVTREESIPISERIRVRRNQVRGVRRSIDAVNTLHRLSGSLGLRNEQRFSKMWRDANVAGNHATNSPEPILRGYALEQIGEEVPEVLRMGPGPALTPAASV